MTQELPDNAIVINGSLVQFWMKILVGVVTFLLIAIIGGLARDYVRGLNQAEQINRIERQMQTTIKETEFGSLQNRIDRMDERLQYIQRHVSEGEVIQ